MTNTSSITENPKKSKRFTFHNIFLSLILFELFLLGSGQLLKLETITLRMFLYICAMIFSFIFILEKSPKVHKSILIMLIFFISIITLTSLIGVVKKAEIEMILINIKPLLYIFMIIPFSLLIKDTSTIYLIQNLIKISGLMMSLIYLITLAAIFFQYIDYQEIYNILSSENDNGDGDFIFGTKENIRIFFKGFLYMNIAFLFFIYSTKKIDKLFAAFILTAIIMTFTRGFLLSLALTFIALTLIEIKKKSLFPLLITTLLTLIIIPMYIAFIGDRSESDLIRYIQIDQVFDATTSLSIFIGNGLGIGVPIRPITMEITYLEIFHKQGIIGLFFWFGLLGYITYNYKIIKNPIHKKILKPFVAGTLFVYFQSLTNPFLNNPIGTSVILISFISALIVVKEDKKEKTKS